MTQYSHIYDSILYPEEQDVDDPFLDASGLDPAGEKPRPDDFSYEDEVDAEATLIDELMRRELIRPRYRLIA